MIIVSFHDLINKSLGYQLFHFYTLHYNVVQITYKYNVPCQSFVL